MENFKNENEFFINNRERLDKLHIIYNDLIHYAIDNYTKGDKKHPINIHFKEIPEKKEPKYRIIINGEMKEFRTLKECSDFSGKTISCLYRILSGSNKYIKQESKALQEIKIEKLSKN